MYAPLTPLFIAMLAVALLVLFVMLEIGVVETAYHKLGMSHRTVTSLLLLEIIGSYINIPVAAIGSGNLVHDRIITVNGMEYVVPSVRAANESVIAINVGGALIPIALSLYLLWRLGGSIQATVATLGVALAVHHFAQLVPGIGIAIPTLIPGVLAAVLAIILDRKRRAAVAYVAGTIGCLLGADIFNLGSIAQLHAPVASIGGAGTFDGVFVSGIIAVLLA